MLGFDLDRGRVSHCGVEVVDVRDSASFRCHRRIHRGMSRDEILARLRCHSDEFGERFLVRSLAVFGSVARGEARAGSDVDILVSFEREPGFDGYLALKWCLEELLGAPVDLVMDDALRPRARATVEAEAVRVT